ncbi:AAA family ATPase [Flavobacterium coralii]|uniref:ATP-dependent nuclease n=1 Tax=Flavobacterium coralii TaxID=2838017 RepID=UPI000C3A2926|nr:ATP-dependent endonuclease [Flavobacterium sp.]|tara:strand:+ start:104386 stop:106011 length:1626 start_codon:yes stop_codon:yes gene_type:complete
MNFIERINIVNYKCFKGLFPLELSNGINIIVGNNEAGKSTILEAIHLALSGLLCGRYLKNELSQYLFNKDVEIDYLASLKTAAPQKPPEIVIEIFFCGDPLPLFEGDANIQRKKGCGISFKIEFDHDYIDDYNELILGDVMTIPIEFYKMTWTTFARDTVSIRTLPVKSVMIDSSGTRFQNGSDVYISKIIKDDLIEKEIVDLSQAYRKMKETFMSDKSVAAINTKITGKADISTKTVHISVDLSAKNSWETSLMTYLEGIPFHQIGKGEQCLIKTNLALAHKKAKESNLILIEEPENHLSHTKLNQFIKSIQQKCEGKQIIVSTHSSFVANKLSLKNLILLHNRKEIRLTALKSDTYDFFEKLPGYETLRMILSKKALLVEGPSDELVFQRAYKDSHANTLPIENEIDIISVGTSFKRFLEIAELVQKPVAVLTDNDKDYATKITKKYKDYAGSMTIKIFADSDNSLNTLEPQIVRANTGNLSNLCDILGISATIYKTEEAISEYMQDNKTECAMKIFNSAKSITYPKYILDAIAWCNEQ